MLPPANAGSIGPGTHLVVMIGHQLGASVAASFGAWCNTS